MFVAHPLEKESQKTNMGPEDVVVQEVVRYFSTPRFKRFSIKEEYPVQIGSYRGRADVALIDTDKKLAAIVECKRSGYEGSGLAQLESYLSATNTPLGVFANEIDPATWRFYEYRGQNQLNQLDRSRFEVRLKRGTIKNLAFFVRSLFQRDDNEPRPPEPVDQPVERNTDKSRIIHIRGDNPLQNSNNIDFDPSLNGNPYYSEASGFYWASNHYGMPECVPQHVKHIISNEELEIKTSHEQLQAKMGRLVEEKNGLEAQRRENEQEIEQRSQSLARKREDLAELEVQLQAPTETELTLPTDDTQNAKQSVGSLFLQSIFPTFITVALLGLLCYLFVFYASVGDKAFSGRLGSVEQQLNEIVNPDALTLAWQAGNWFVLLIPCVFLILAITTHLSWEHRDQAGMKKLLVFALSVTAILDIVIAVKISRNIHEEKIVRGIPVEEWTIFNLDILAVILLGFAVSLLLSCAFYWSVRLWKGVGSLRRQSKEQELRESQIEDEKVQRNARIAALRTNMENLQREINPLDEKVKTAQRGIDQRQAEIEELLELQNKRFVNRHQIESRVSQFLKGWNRFIVHSGDGKIDVSAQINKVKQTAYETINQYYDGSEEHLYQS